MDLQADDMPVVAPQYTTLPCVHCTEPTRCDVSQDPAQVFCCRGCQGAFELIHGWGLEEFYALRDQMNVSGAASPGGQRDGYEQFDTVEFLGRDALVQNNDGTCSAELAIHGLHCGACAWLIETAIGHEPGLLSARVQMSTHSIRLIFQPKLTQLSKIAKFLDRLGYSLSPLDVASDANVRSESRRQLIQIAIAGFLAANSMWIAVALYAGEFTGVAFEHRYFLSIIGTVLGVASVAIPGRTFFKGAISALRHRVPHMDMPVALGLAVGTVVGALNALRGVGHVYFDSLSALVFLLLIGRWVQFRQQQRAMKAVDLMLRITPRHAVLVRENGHTVTVLAETLAPHNLIRIAAGDSVAADGLIVRGETKLDRSLLNGESKPISAGVGDAVMAGTINVMAPIDVRVTAVGRDSRIGRVMQSVEDAASTRTPLVQLADRIGGYFVLVVTVLAVATFLTWLGSGINVATAHATSLLIVACPCALALATPLAISVGLGRAARLGILIRDGNAFQLLSKPGRIWLDKTGTLTEGKQSVSAIFGAVDGLRLASLLEAHCKHPVADAIVREAKIRFPQLNLTTAEAIQASIEIASAGGVTGTLCVDDQLVQLSVGNLRFTEQLDADIDDRFRAHLAGILDSGASPILVAVNGRVVTLLGISDRLRAGAADLVQSLQNRGWEVGILSGDHPAIVKRVGSQLGIAAERCLGGLSPEDKLDAIRRRNVEPRSIVMVGDGANDAAALAAADVGIAVRGGAEVSLQAAPVFVASGRLSSILNLLHGSARTTRIIWATFAFALAYNIAAVGLAMVGWITPLVAAVLMPVSSVTILAMILTTKTFGKEIQ
jgi:P-type Cu2+ transporter